MSQTEKDRSHPWRICPVGQHWVRTHPMDVPVSKKNPDGVTTRHGHCANNPSHKDFIHSDELNEIAKEHFTELKGPPKADDLGFKNKGNRYDEFIRGWTQFWNDTLNPKDRLDPNLVKALIATESGFNPNPKVGAVKARGLMQVTDSTRKILANPKGELHDHLVEIDQKDITDPNLNIAAGTRWLFRKKDLAGVRLKRTATWDEAVAEYKSYLKDMIKDPKYLPKPMAEFRKYYKQLSE